MFDVVPWEGWWVIQVHKHGRSNGLVITRLSLEFYKFEERSYCHDLFPSSHQHCTLELFFFYHFPLWHICCFKWQYLWFFFKDLLSLQWLSLWLNENITWCSLNLQYYDVGVCDNIFMKTNHCLQTVTRFVSPQWVTCNIRCQHTHSPSGVTCQTVT